ncbi:putative amidohydrolase YtcJ [Kribbella aluminosa]|uniref:Amidohydrolase YtcJ n=1 Tax=Kribbella aluminosa TaxID=416017 RepID=A0ABS4UK26_9ACTN|nr:amidohydrolase family protein [Kribbella aluminosa]MBP2351970.1 putative amidohydrolase YtcJ [Kribbella aluminosa]
MSAKPVVLRQVRLGSDGPIVDVRIVDNRLAAIGEVIPETGDAVLYHRGATLLPGLIDGHVHTAQWAERRRRIDVQRARSASEAVELVAAALRDRPPVSASDVVMAHGFRDGLWTTPPHKDLLESALPGVRVAVMSQDLHAIWLSPALLQHLGREDATGVLREQDCVQVNYDLSRDLPPELVDRWVLEATRAAARRGITSIIDFEYADNRTDWVRRSEQGPVPVRVKTSIWRPWLDEAIELGLHTGDPVPGGHGLIEVGPFKLVADGSLNTRTAYCHDPYPEAAAGERHGLLLIDEDELVTLMTLASSNGLDPAVHAIGDRANTIALNAFDRVGCRGRIEHAQLVRPADAARFARPGLITSIQPQHAMSDRDVADRHWPDRTAAAFPYGSLLRAGATLELGSDAPVAEPDPWHAIADAVHRTDDDRPPWHVEQAIPLPAALKAAAGGRRQLIVGDPADLVLVPEDPATLSNADLRALPVLATLVAGQVSFLADDFGNE